MPRARDRQKLMTLATADFIRRFLIHVLPHGFHRIRHYGLLASGTRADNTARARGLLAVSNSQAEPTGAAVDPGKPTCPCCGGRMIIMRSSSAVQRHGIGQQVQRSSSGSTPHDRVTIAQI